MIKRPKISVLIPVCNTEDYLRRCIGSVLAQTLREIEVICINDGSADSSPEILQQYAQKDARVVVIDKPNSGYGDSMNTGLAAAKGEYIGIVESDDFIDRRMYQKLYARAEKQNADIVKANFYNYYEEAGSDEANAQPDTDRIQIPTSKEPFTLAENGQFSWGHPSVWSAIYRREFLEENGIRFMAEKGGGWVDNPFYYETLCAAKRIMWVNEPLYYYRKTNQNSSSNRQKDVTLPFRWMQDNFDVLDRHHVRDEGTLKCAYARALMYCTGAQQDFDYDANAEEIHSLSARLMARFDEDVFLRNFNVEDKQRYFSHLSAMEGLKRSGPKVLLYNWLPYDNQWNSGGGVTVYCRNLIQQIRKDNPEVSIYFLSSGFAYVSTILETYVRRIPAADAEVHQYEIVNSPVLAEQRYMYRNPLVALENESLRTVFSDFLEEFGPFNVIHFNNIEGISLDVLDLKKLFPKTKFIYSIHNYVPMCVNGSYYMRHKHKICSPDHTGADCFACTRADIRRDIADATYDRGKYGQEMRQSISKGKWTEHFGFQRLDEDVSPDRILDFARTATAKINENCDHVLAVSKRVYDIAKENGFDERKLSVSYIGTKVAQHQLGHAAYEVRDYLKIVFLGSDIDYEEKGYPFLLETLEKLEPRYASQIDLVLTVRQKEHAQIYSMLRHFHSLKVINGYTHEDLPSIFEGCHLSLVPVLWEDNLPQIAIESVAYGVPVLSSSAGGASELCDSALFVFESGNGEDLRAKIRHFLEFPEDLKVYWEHHHGLVTMREHWEQLRALYGLESSDVVIRAEAFRSILREHSFLSESLHEVASEGAYGKLQDRIRELEAEKRELKMQVDRLRDEGVESMRGTKVIFQKDIGPAGGELGAELFRIVLDDFPFSDFYAEIKFVHMSNIAPSFSDTLIISGTLLGENEGERQITLHQFTWKDGGTPLSELIAVALDGNTATFWGAYNGICGGYLYRLETLTSRAEGDSARFEKISEGFLYEYTLRPIEAVNAAEQK